MSLSHSVQIANKQNDSLNPIIQFLNTLNDVPQKYASFEKAEQAIRELVVELEKSMVQETLSQYDINTPIIVRDGKVYRQVLRQNKMYTSAAGPVEVERSLYRAEEHCICPLELQAGIIEGYWTPMAARLGCYVTAQLSPYQGEKLFEEFGRLFDGHPQDVANRGAFIFDFEGFTVVTFPLTDVAGHIDVRQEVHFNLYNPVALAIFTAPAFDVKTEAAGFVATDVRFRRTSK